MPGTVEVSILEAKDLPVMDRASELTDAFVEIRFGGRLLSTEVCPKTLNPTWASKVYKFDVDDTVIQDEPVQLKVLDYDMYSASDPIGMVYIGLNPLVARDTTSTLDGWFPIYDTIHGLRGSLHVGLKVKLFSDQHFLRQSSCGVQFFTTSSLPFNLQLDTVYGFVEELVANDDPEYQWKDKIRTPRASNEARHLVFMKLSGKLQRQIGLKAMELGGNVILGYRQHFDLEGESGVVVRGIGTAVTVTTVASGGRNTSPAYGVEGVAHGNEIQPVRSEENVITQMSSSFGSEGPKCPVPTPTATPIRLLRPHSTSTESDGPEAVHSTPRGGLSAEVMAEDSMSSSEPQQSRPLQGLKTKDFPFVTLRSLCPGAVRAVGGVVSARSVKLLEKFDNPEDPQTRDNWWKQVRLEIRSHMKAFGCSEVMGYTETTAINGSLCVLSASGTAVCIDWNKVAPHRVSDAQDEDHNDSEGHCPVPRLPYATQSGRTLLEKNLTKCRLCMKHVVPNLLLVTMDLQPDWPIRGQGTMVQIRVCRPRKKHQGDFSAYEMNEKLPELEHKLHCRLLDRLKVLGMNMVAGLAVKLSIGDNIITALAEGTAVFLEGLPGPGEFSQAQMASDVPEQEWRQLHGRQMENLKQFALLQSAPLSVSQSEPSSPTDGEFPDPTSTVPLMGGGKLLSVDEEKMKREDVAHCLQQIRIPSGFYLSTLSHAPGFSGPLQSSKLYSVVRKYDIQPRNISEHFINQECLRAVESLVFKCRREHPCHLTNLQLAIAYPEDNEVLLMLTGLASKVASPDDQEHAFSAQVDEPEATVGAVKDHVTMTSCDVIEGSTITRHLGVINFFIIRETTNLHERGGTAGFLQMFLQECSLIVVETVKAFGGNAVVNFKLNECILMDSPNKHQGQCLLNVSGDVVLCESTFAAVSPVHQYHSFKGDHFVPANQSYIKTPPAKKVASFQETEC